MKVYSFMLFFISFEYGLQVNSERMEEKVKKKNSRNSNDNLVRSSYKFVLRSAKVLP